MDEQEKWQQMMKSARKACNVLGIDFSEPMYLDWKAGAKYHEILWGQVRMKRGKK